MSMFVKLKRDTKYGGTWFIHCEATDRVQKVVDQLADIEGMKSSQIRVLRDVDTPLAEDQSLKEQDVGSLQILFAVWRTDDGWEAVDVKTPEYEARNSF